MKVLFRDLALSLSKGEAQDDLPMVVYVYILHCSDGSYYVGSTRSTLERRVAEHNAGAFGGYTKSRRPVDLVYQESFVNAVDAIAMERRLKGWSRAKKEALIRGDLGALRPLAKAGSKKKYC